jgi:hypothetical protein
MSARSELRNRTTYTQRERERNSRKRREGGTLSVAFGKADSSSRVRMMLRVLLSIRSSVSCGPSIHLVYIYPEI